MSGKPTIMVSSVVYGMEDLLEQIFSVLSQYGYEVWMSHKGTVPTDPRRSNFDNCVQAVEACDVFLGLISGRYGSGVDADGLSITHRELKAAILADKPRWFLVHNNIVVARQLLKQFRFDENGNSLPLDFKRTSILDDVRILDMYEQAIRQELPLGSRTGNWVQPYFYQSEVLVFLKAQFEDLDRVEELLRMIREAP